MPVFDPQHDPSALKQRLRQADGLTVVCYCAAWCGTCAQYRPAFESLAGQWPDHTFVWVDIEENPELLGDDDVENFPTLLIQGAQGNLFFGTLLPYISHLDRLIAQAGDTAPIAGGPPALRTLAEAL